MAKKQRVSRDAGLQEASALTQTELSRDDTAPESEVTTSPADAEEAAETFGLAVASPPEPELYQEQGADEEASVEVAASETISSDPAATIAAALLALGGFYNRAGVISVALSKHLRGTAGEPELHAFIMRNQSLLGEFRHHFEQIESGISESLRDAIMSAMAA